AVTSSTATYRGEMRTPQLRQRPRRSRYDRTGTLSRGAIAEPQLMQADPGGTSDLRNGTRAATTLRKLPIARLGADSTAASARFTIPETPGQQRLALRTAI